MDYDTCVCEDMSGKWLLDDVRFSVCWNDGINKSISVSTLMTVNPISYGGGGVNFTPLRKNRNFSTLWKKNIFKIFSNFFFFLRSSTFYYTFYSSTFFISISNFSPPPPYDRRIYDRPYEIGLTSNFLTNIQIS